jgi:hypothetical protein
MSGKVVIRQLWDKQKQKTPTVAETDRSLIGNKKTWDYQGRKYVTFQNISGQKPYENHGNVTWVNLTRNHNYRIPTKFTKKENRSQQEIDYSKLLHDLYEFSKKYKKYGGNGYYNVYIIGGQSPPIKYILQAWLVQGTTIKE